MAYKMDKTIINDSSHDYGDDNHGNRNNIRLMMYLV